MGMGKSEVDKKKSPMANGSQKPWGNKAKAKTLKNFYTKDE